ncbi:unnamed protein product, partial [Linum tenue]
MARLEEDLLHNKYLRLQFVTRTSCIKSLDSLLKATCTSKATFISSFYFYDYCIVI